MFYHQVLYGRSLLGKRLFSDVVTKKSTISDFARWKRRGKKIPVVTAYDYPTAKHAQSAGIPVVLVGDSVAMVSLGHQTTQQVSLEAMIHHTIAARKGAPSSFLICDMPFGSYEIDVKQAVTNAFRVIQETGADAIKLEGGTPFRCETIRAITSAGIPVMAHVGLTPQSVGVLGGFKAQGKNARAALEIIKQAQAVAEAGAFSVVLECVPEVVAEAVTNAISIPTIGIGAGAKTSGQVLVFHDLLGIAAPPSTLEFPTTDIIPDIKVVDNNASTSERMSAMAANAVSGDVSTTSVPRFCKQYGHIGTAIHWALRQYREEVEAGIFPSPEYSPYKMSAIEEQIFRDSAKQWLSDTQITYDDTSNVSTLDESPYVIPDLNK